MPYCLHCESPVDSSTRKGSVMEPHVSRSTVDSMTFGSRGPSTRSTYSTRTTWRRRSIKIPVCTRCGEDLRFPEASSARECWVLRNRAQRDSLIHSLLWTAFVGFAVAAYFLGIRDYAATVRGWSKIGAYLGGLGLGPLVGAGIVSFVVSEYAPHVVVDVLVAFSRRVGAGVVYTPLATIGGFVAGRVVQPGTETTAAIVGGSVAAAVVLLLFVADAARLIADRRHLYDLALREVMAENSTD